MAKRMLVDATHAEETRVAIVDGQRLDDLDFEVANRKMLKGNIYLAKVIRIEPSLQAAFVEYGGNRHGFLAFSEIHPDYYRIPVGDRPEDAHEDEDLADAPIITEGPGKLDYDENEAEFGAAANDGAFAEPGIPGSEPLEGTAPHPAQPLAVDDAHSVKTSWTAHDADHGADAGFGIENNSSLISDFSQPIGSDAELLTEGAAVTPVETVGGEAADQAPERFVRPRRTNYKIQEVIKRRQVMLIQVVKEERGNKGAALTTYLSLAGRYCVLMPNTAHGGGVSRKITNHQDRRRMKEILDQLDVPEGMALILRTAGMEQEVADIQRDMDYLLRLWNNIREQTLQSTAPALIYEEANLIKRALRDLYGKDIAEILVAGREGYDRARDFMQMMIPDAVDQIRLYEEPVPLFFRYNVEEQVDALHSPVVQLRSGGYLVINPTEALVAIDVNSGRSTRERHIEETALKTNLEAAEEVGRQLRLRDFAGLIVIDFIDMEDGRNNAAVERKLKEAMRSDRARLQIGRISHFGLMELSRQRLRPSLLETNFEKCPHCEGLGYVRAIESTALSVLRGLEQEGIKNRGGDYCIKLPGKVALYILNNKRTALAEMQQRYGLTAQFEEVAGTASAFTIERVKNRSRDANDGPAVNLDDVMASTEAPGSAMPFPIANDAGEREPREGRSSESRGERRGGRDGRRSRGNRPPRAVQVSPEDGETDLPEAAVNIQDNASDAETPAVIAGEGNDQRPRRRGRRGGRRRGRQDGERNGDANGHDRAPRAPFNGEGGESAAVPTPFTPPPMALDIPRSIHELDTTPREKDAPRVFPSYENVNEAPEKPKAGWWRRLTGQ